MSSMNKTIFYVSDEGDEAKASKRAVNVRVPEQAKGLLIVMHEEEKGSNVLTESATATSGQARQPESGFLQACGFCLRELNPCRDVYMYRGDQGFCSDECRSRHIDSAKEESSRSKVHRGRETTNKIGG